MVRLRNILFLSCAFLWVASVAFSDDVRNTYVGLATQVADGILTNAKLASMANSTIKCRTTSGTGVAEDCTAAQAAAIIAVPGGALKAFVGTFSRDMTAASGSASITGVGFTPTSLSISCNIDGSTTSAEGFAVAGASRSSNFRTGTYGGIFNPFTISTAASTGQAAAITMTADGFDIAWTKEGTPTGSAFCTFLAQR